MEMTNDNAKMNTVKGFIILMSMMMMMDDDDDCIKDDMEVVVLYVAFSNLLNIFYENFESICNQVVAALAKLQHASCCY